MDTLAALRISISQESNTIYLMERKNNNDTMTGKEYHRMILLLLGCFVIFKMFAECFFSSFKGFGMKHIDVSTILKLFEFRI